MSGRRPGRFSNRLSQRQLGVFYVVLAALLWSTAGVLQRGLQMGIPTQVAGRALFALITLFFVTLWHNRAHPHRVWRLQLSELAMGTFMALASGTFMVALNFTSVANVLIMQASSPILSAVISWRLLKEPITRRTAVAMALAVSGVVGILGAPSGSSPIGSVLSIVTTIGFAGAVVVARQRQDISMASAVGLSQLLVLAVSAPFAHPTTVGAHDLVRLVLLGTVQVGAGLTFLTLGARLLPAAEVALVSLLEVVLGPFWVWLFLAERPSTWTLAGGAVVIVAVTAMALERDREPATEEQLATTRLRP